MVNTNFNPPLEVQVSSGVVIQVPKAKQSGAGTQAQVQLWNGKLIHAETFNIENHKQRAQFAHMAHENDSFIDEQAINKALVTMSVQLQKQSTGDSDEAAPREQLSLTPPNIVTVARGDGDELVYVLRHEDGTLSVAPSVVGPFEGETVTHVPPPGMPWLWPRAENVLDHYEHAHEEGWAATLLADLEAWHRNASDLGRDGAYLLLALFDLLTYIQELTDYLPIILLEAEPERGKTRTGQALVYVARHGMHLQGIREANLIRDAHDRQATLFIDLMNVWKTAEREKVEDVILSRWERGGTVERVLYPEKGAFADTVRYGVFGPTIIATNEPIHRILDTRCLRVDMPLSKRTFKGKVLATDALSLVERLTAWRAAMMGRALVDCEPPTSGRLGDILRPLKQALLTVAPERAAEFDTIVKWQTKRREDELAQSTEAVIVAAVAACASKVAYGWLPLSHVLEHFNMNRDDYQAKPKWMAGKLRGLGWTIERVGHYNATSLRWDADLLACLQNRYGQGDDSTDLDPFADTQPSEDTRDDSPDQQAPLFPDDDEGEIAI